MRVSIELDEDERVALCRVAKKERRTMSAQASVLLRNSLVSWCPTLPPLVDVLETSRQPLVDALGAPAPEPPAPLPEPPKKR